MPLGSEPEVSTKSRSRRQSGTVCISRFRFSWLVYKRSVGIRATTASIERQTTPGNSGDRHCGVERVLQILKAPGGDRFVEPDCAHDRRSCSHVRADAPTVVPAFVLMASFIVYETGLETSRRTKISATTRAYSRGGGRARRFGELHRRWHSSGVSQDSRQRGNPARLGGNRRRRRSLSPIAACSSRR